MSSVLRLAAVTMDGLHEKATETLPRVLAWLRRSAEAGAEVAVTGGDEIFFIKPPADFHHLLSQFVFRLHLKFFLWKNFNYTLFEKRIPLK